MRQLVISAIGMAFLMTFAGCMDGPFYAAKRLNPFFRSRWRAEREYGPTFEDRVAELEQLNRQIADLPDDQQAEWAKRLEKMIREDASPEIRSRAVRVVSQIPTEAAERALNSASTDDVEKVRLVACKAWTKRGGTPARDMLLSLASADESNSVRQAAIDELRTFNDPEVLRAMASLLEDSSPAVQYQVAESLVSMTGQDFGGDMDRWKQYLNSATPGIQSDPMSDTRVLPASGLEAP